MPFSANECKDWIKSHVTRMKPRSMLDVGPGAGTYAKLFPLIPHKDAVEIWEPYVEKYALDKLYRHVTIKDIREYRGVASYDVVFFGDVLEHMSREEAARVVSDFKPLAKYIVISIPIGDYPQGEFEGNPHEAHKSTWSVEDVFISFGKPLYMRVENNIGAFIYGDPIPLKIAVYAICNGEKHFVERFMKSCEGADAIIIGDTGCPPTDDAALEFRRLGATVYPIHITPFRFDLTRNAVMALIPPDIDVCISLDVDEVMVEGWRERIEKVWEPGVTNNLWYYFDWGHGIVFPYHKIHSRAGWHWHHACHEDLRLDARMQVQNAHAYEGGALVKHYPDQTKSRGSYMAILEASVKEDPHDPTHYFYYARELVAYQRYDEGITALERYLEISGPSYQNERCYAMREMAKAWMGKGDLRKAEGWAAQAAAEAPNTREPWFLLAELAYRKKSWWESLAYAQRCVSIKDRAKVYTCDPSVWTGQIHDYLALAAYNLKFYNIAIEHGKLAIELSPEDPRFKTNLGFYLKEKDDAGKLPDLPTEDAEV